MKTKISLMLFCIVFFVGGCSDGLNAPHMGFGNFEIATAFSKDDIVVMDRVTGTSDTLSIFCGLIQIIDGEHL